MNLHCENTHANGCSATAEPTAYLVRHSLRALAGLAGLPAGPARPVALGPARPVALARAGVCSHVRHKDEGVVVSVVHNSKDQRNQHAHPCQTYAAAACLGHWGGHGHRRCCLSTDRTHVAHMHTAM